MRLPRFVALLLVCLFFQCVVPCVYPQEASPGAAQRTGAQQPRKRLTLSCTVGVGMPLSKAALRQFWNGSAAASASLLVSVNRLVALGIGMDVAVLTFRESKFTEAFPGVTVQVRNTAFLNLSIGWRYTPFWRYRFAPYVGATVGAGRLTGAEYKQTVNGVRVTYYEIPGMTRLSLGGMIGADYLVSNGVALTMEGKGTYLHNDPEAGVVIAVSGGVRVLL